MLTLTNLIAQDDGPAPLWIVPIVGILGLLGIVGFVFVPVLLVKGGARLLGALRRLFSREPSSEG